MTARQVMDDFKKINRETDMSVIMNIHHVEIALEYADRIIGVKEGQVVYDGKSTEVTDDVLDLIYKGKVEEIQSEAEERYNV